MRNRIIRLFYFAFSLFCIAFLPSCNRDEELFVDEHPSYLTIDNEGEIILDQQLNDPYDVEFMAKAFDMLSKRGAEFPFNSITPNAKYIRTLVNSTEDIELLEADTSIKWFDFPLDYEIPEGGTHFHDHTLPDTVEWKYGVVPVNYNPPSPLKSETIHLLFFPDMHPLYEDYEDLFDELEELSEKLCENPQTPTEATIELGNSTQSIFHRQKWAPEATISAWDDTVKRYIPLQNVVVFAIHYTKIRSEVTNADGYCKFPKDFYKNHRVKYLISWQQIHWRIRDDFWQAYYNGPKTKQNWNLKISGEKSIMYATIHRAAYRAFLGDYAGLIRPNAMHRLQFSYHHSYNGNTLGQNMCFANFFGIIPNINIWGKTVSGSPRKTDDVFGTAIHEMGHQTHLQKMNLLYYTCNSFVKESWARCVQWYITNDYYINELGLTGYNHHEGFQKWSYSLNDPPSAYTPAMIDLIDNYNQTNESSGNTIDNISGYTPLEIQDSILPYSFNLYSYKKTLKSHLYHGATEDDVDNLLNYYEGIGF